MMKMGKINRALFFCCALVAAGRAQTARTHMSAVIPSNPILSDSLDWIAGAVAYPGVRPCLAQTRIAAGFTSTVSETRSDYASPETPRAEKNDQAANLSPYLAAQLPGARIASGIYLGNFHADMAERTARSPDDTIKNFMQSNVRLDGAVWVAADTRFFQGASLWAEGAYLRGELHHADIDISRKIHSLFAQKRKHGAGILTGVFSFAPSRYGLIRVGYGKDVVTATENRLDTLLFTRKNFITSSVRLDSSYEQTYTKLEIGGIARSDGMHLGLLLGGDRAHCDYAHEDIDSSRFSVNVFFGKRIDIHTMRLFTGLDIACRGVLYNRSAGRLGYWQLAKAYTTRMMAHDGAAEALVFGAVPIGARITTMAGFRFRCDYRLSNYAVASGESANQKHAGQRFVLYPLSVRYRPSPKIAITVSPKIDGAVVIGSAEIACDL